MRKYFKFYFIVWLILLGVFNAICFIIPEKIGNVSTFDGAFWVGYIFITAAFVGQLACAYLTFKETNLQKFFYKIPLIDISYIGLIIMVFIGILTMTISSFPNWLGVLICLLILAFTAVAITKAYAASAIVGDIDEKIKVQTEFIKTMTMITEHIVSSAKSDIAKAECKKVYEAIRYSDKMSNPKLVSDETAIADMIMDFKNVVDTDNIDVIRDVAFKILFAVKERNLKCRLSKG